VNSLRRINLIAVLMVVVSLSMLLAQVKWGGGFHTNGFSGGS
jgi:hypothetical protein